MSDSTPQSPRFHRHVRRWVEAAPAWIFTILAVAGILWLTLAPHPLGEEELPLFPGADKIAHGLMFFCLTIISLCDWARKRQWKKMSAAILWTVALLNIAFGIGIEFLQRMMELGRGFEIKDMVADAVGVALAVFSWHYIYKYHNSRKVSSSNTSEVANSNDKTSDENPSESHDPKHHVIRQRWVRILLKTFGWILLVVVLIPVAIYIPPVQTMLKNVACNIIRKQTGMNVSIDRFRLKFPLDVSLQGVKAIEAGGDTLACVDELIADVKLLPLLKLDAQVNKLELRRGYYRMVAPDSSMIMKIRAGFLDVSPGSSADIASSNILLDKARLRDGDISLYMNVWKKKPVPADSVQPSTPFLIKARQLDLENITFAMSMLPVIDTLRVSSNTASIADAIIDLGANKITASRLNLNHGKFRYVAPDPEYVRTHPAPIDTITPPSPPMKISADNIDLTDFKGVYTIKGSRPLPGFDANYVDVSDVDVRMHDFYNEASTVVLPITSIKARERCGLQITEGSGTFRLDSIGMRLADFKVRTPYSHVDVAADLPFALMELKPEAPVNVDATVSLGLGDIVNFMPSLRQYISAFPSRSPLNATVKANGTLSDVAISKLDAAMPGIFSLRAFGKARNPLDFDRIDAFIDMEGEVYDPSPIQRLAGPLDFKIPSLRLKGTAGALGKDYRADFTLVTPQGSLAARGSVGLNSERYVADLDVNNVNVAHFMPTLGIGSVTASVHASGAGFNPVNHGASTDFDLNVGHIVYNGTTLSDITLVGSLADGNFAITGHSPNQNLNFDIDLEGSVAPDLYDVTGTVNLYHADLQALGFSKEMCQGTAILSVDATASPDKWLYDATLDISGLDWNMPGQYIHLPNGVHAYLKAVEDHVTADVESQLTTLHFESRSGLSNLIDSFMAAAEEAEKQVKDRELVMDEIQKRLPQFSLSLNASGRGLIKQLLNPSEMSVDTVYAAFTNDSILRGNAGMLALNTGSLKIDTLSLNLSQRGKLLDYKAHIGNAPGTFDEFAKVDLNGYLGSNRVSAYLRQHNIQGEMGYRLGLTAALMDSTLSIHFTPLKSTIAYLPWTLNSDNHIDLNISTLAVNANLMAKSKESSILVETIPDENDGSNSLHLNLTNIKVQDFLQLSVFAPPLTATVNSDLKIHYDGKTLAGGGNLAVSDFTYDKTYVGDFDLKVNAGVDFRGDSNVALSMDVDNRPDAIALQAVLTNVPEAGLEPRNIDLILNKFPLRIANAFIGTSTARLDGFLNGKMDMKGSFSAPQLNGYISCDSVSAYIPFMGTTLRFDTVPLTVADNLINFDKFDVWAANANPITLDGNVDATDFSKISFDLGLSGKNVKLVGSDKRARSELYGNLFVDLNASARGQMSHFDVNANLSVLSSTNVGYNIPTETSMNLSETDENVVKFVNFSDTTQVVQTDTVPRSMFMRVNAALNIVPGATVTVNLSNNGTDKVQISPSGTLNYFMNYMGDMRLNGQLLLGNGFARYSIPVIGQKMFEFDPQSYVSWNGDIMNPVLNVKATDQMKANVMQSGGNSHLVNFLVKLSASGTLNHPALAFDLSTDDDMSVQNELQSMSADQRQQQAMQLLLTGQYSGPGMKSAAGSMISTGTVYSMLASQLNSWAAKTIRGVDLSFGVDQYDKSTNGNTTTTTSYSYQLSKSLFNNKFKIAVGGNYSTDASADENLTQNLISDISFEYMLKQTSTRTMLVKLFRHTGYESILEGEVTETGVGFVMKRRLQSLRGLFRFGPKKHKDKQPADSVADVRAAADTIGEEKKGEVK